MEGRMLCRIKHELNTRRFLLFFSHNFSDYDMKCELPEINDRFSSFKMCSHGAVRHTPKNMYMHILRACLP